MPFPRRCEYLATCPAGDRTNGQCQPRLFSWHGLSYPWTLISAEGERIVERRLAAVLMAGVVGYSRLMEEDEAGTLTALKERRKSVLEPIIRAHGGRLVKVMGDGVLVEVASAVNAVTGALELQRQMAAANEPLPSARRIVLRIGINLGDVI